MLVMESQGRMEEEGTVRVVRATRAELYFCSKGAGAAAVALRLILPVERKLLSVL